LSLHLQGTAPSLVLRAFGEFLDLTASAELDSVTCTTTLALLRDMSRSYTGEAA
jgi:hypothetical protein